MADKPDFDQIICGQVGNCNKEECCVATTTPGTTTTTEAPDIAPAPAPKSVPTPANSPALGPCNDVYNTQMCASMSGCCPNGDKIISALLGACTQPNIAAIASNCIDSCDALLPRDEQKCRHVNPPPAPDTTTTTTEAPATTAEPAGLWHTAWMVQEATCATLNGKKKKCRRNAACYYRSGKCHANEPASSAGAATTPVVVATTAEVTPPTTTTTTEEPPRPASFIAEVVDEQAQFCARFNRQKKKCRNKGCAWKNTSKKCKPVEDATTETPTAEPKVVTEPSTAEPIVATQQPSTAELVVVTQPSTAEPFTVPYVQEFCARYNGRKTKCRNKGCAFTSGSKECKPADVDVEPTTTEAPTPEPRLSPEYCAIFNGQKNNCRATACTWGNQKKICKAIFN
jgi:hypothetical protein